MRFLIVVLSWLILTNTVQATSPIALVRMEVSQKGPKKSFVDAIYLITISCSTKGKYSVTDLPTTYYQMLVKKSVAVSHIVTISRSRPGSKGDGTALLPADTIAFIQTYAVRDGAAAEDFRHLCNREILYNGPEPLFLINNHSESITYLPSTFSQIISSVLPLITPAWTLFGGVPAMLNANVTNVTTVQKGINEAIAKLNSAYNFPNTPLELGEGRFEIKSDYLDMTINVARIPSVVEFTDPDASKVARIRKSFRDELVAANITETDFQNRCALMYQNMSVRGFSAKTDIPFALIWLGAYKSQPPELIKCLGRDSALAATEALMNDPLWRHIRPDRRFSKADVLSLGAPVTPSHIKVSGFLDNFTQKHNQLTTVPQLKDTIIAEMRDFFDINFSFSDRSRGLRVRQLKEKMKLTNRAIKDVDVYFELILNQDANYRRAACYQPALDKNGLSSINVNSVYLMFKGTSSSLPVSDVLMAFVKFAPNDKILEIVFHDNPDWIKSSLHADNTCYGIKVTDLVGEAEPKK